MTLSSASSFDRRQRSGRFVEDHHAVRHLQHARDLDELAARDGKPRICVVGSMSAPRLRTASRDRRFISRSLTMSPAFQLAAHENVLGDSEIRREQDLLVHQDEAAMFRVDGPGEVSPVHRRSPQSPRVGCKVAAHELHQRRLAGTVFADDRVHLARHDRQTDVRQHLDRPERLGEPARFQHGLGSFGGWVAVASITPSSRRRPLSKTSPQLR